MNKIKTRFANQPDIYKQFLEILQTYQREQKPIGEVYEQVTLLFSNSPDLLDDFKQFLPDTRQAYADDTSREGAGRDSKEYYGGGNQLPPVGNFPPPSGTNGVTPYGAPVQYPQGGYPGATGLAGEQSYDHYQHPQQQFELHPHSQQVHQQSPLQQPQHDIQHQPLPHQAHQSQNIQNLDSTAKDRKSAYESSAFDTNYNAGSTDVLGVRSSVQPVSRKAGSPNKTVSAVSNPTLVPGVPEPVPPSGSAKQSSLQEEISFFDKVKKAISNKQTYNEFLKILNLFSQDIIDKETLVERVSLFIGNGHPELIQWFKVFVGYEEKPQHIETITFKKHQLELSLCKAYGPSYRQLPKSETYMPCSGRDEMCWEVLNDEWVGHPTWASEDSGFIAHRKNQYEEILFKIEEERHEFDYYMESNLRTIQTLETIANRIANMTPEQKVAFKLPPGLGHTSSTIYRKVIRKIYDKDRGFEVIDALHENPAIAVPIVLKRLKQKDEEWKRSHREWNKVWREMEQKVFYKSLDHLGLTFKQADKKLLTAKQLVSEISTVKVEQQNKRLHPLTPKPQEQLNYEFTDFGVLIDILRLADVFINKSSNYSVSDREKLTQFFKFFLSLFFGISSDYIEDELKKKAKGAREVTLANTKNDKSDSIGSNGSGNKRGRDFDLLKGVLKKLTKSRKDETMENPQLSDSEEQEYSEEIEKSGELWINTTSKKHSLSGSSSPTDNYEVARRSKYHLFCNTTTYVFFRHLRTLYERLIEVKALNEEVIKEIRSRKIAQFAKDLNLVLHQLEDMNIQITGDKNCYQQVLELSEKLIEGELDHQWFEETVRQGYRNKAYKMYTVDKVVQSIVKHMHTMVTDSKTSDMMLLFENDRSKPQSTAKDQILYRMQVRSLMSNDENMFKLTMDETSNTANIQFVSLDDLTITDHKNSEEDYNYYVTSYVMSHPTEGIKASKLSMPFLKSFIESIDEEQCEGYVDAGLKVSICENSYKMFFEPGSHDEYTSNFVYKKQPEEKSSRVQKLTAFTELIEGDVGWKRTLEEDESADILEANAQTLINIGGEAYLKKTKLDAETAEFAASEKSSTETTQESTSEVHDQDVPHRSDLNSEISQPTIVTAESSRAADIEQELSQASDDIKNTLDQADATSISGVAEPKDADEIKPDTTIDADLTVVQNYNDTTIQQDGNDTTTDEVTMANEDTTVFEDANNTTNP